MQMISEELVNCSTAYYNENDPFAAAWLRELITAGHIAHGIVDERSIEDVTPNDLVGFTQCHFFAGIGGWSHALRLAGWPDDRSVWTGSCPCQPFSAAGKGAGFADERHLWPAFHWLIQQCGPSVVFGEQVASKATSPWFDLVQADLEAMGYDFGCIPFPAAGVGAPHLRDRAFWVAYSESKRERRKSCVEHSATTGPFRDDMHIVKCPSEVFSGMGNAHGQGPQGLTGDGGAAGREGAGGSVTEAGVSSGLADSEHVGHSGAQINEAKQGRDRPDYGIFDRGASGLRNSGTGPTNGFWQDVDWLLCRDGKWRTVEPGTFPLAHGVSARVGRLRGYGNAIVPQAAAEFIQAFQGEKESSYD